MNRQYKGERADIVIVGNGIAGLTAAVEARRLAPDLSIVLITEQCHPTINTPALKQFAIGKLTQEQLLAYPAGTEHTQRISVVNARVEGINAQSKFVYLNGGYGFGYGSLLIATGSVPNGLPANLPGRDFDGVLTLHSMQDYLNLRRRVSEVDEAVVIGGGTHAIETVMALLHLGISVHWLIRSKTFLSQMLDHPASEMVLERVRHAGAKVCTQTHVTGIVGRVGSVVGVVTNQQQMLPCQLVLTCTGTTPSTLLAERCNVPMMHKHGIFVDDQLCTNVPDIYAAGAVAALNNPQTGSYETRAQWYAGVLQGRTVAATMTGHYELAARPFGVPWHATQLGNLCMLSVGNLQSWTEDVVTLTDSSKKHYCRMSMIDDRLVSYLSLGPTQPDSLAIKRIIDEGLSIRDVKKALLKGTFDARKYFSQQQSHAAREMVTSGKLPAINWVQNPVPITRSPVVISPSLQASSPYTTAALPSLPTTGHLMRVQVQQTKVSIEAELMLATVYNQPTLPMRIEAMQTKVSAQTDAPLSTVYEQLTLHGVEEEMIALASNLSQKSIDSMLFSLPRRTVSRSLWSYSGKMPVVEAEAEP